MYCTVLYIYIHFTSEYIYPNLVFEKGSLPNKKNESTLKKQQQ